MMRVLFAPDFRAGVPYQTLLAEALVRQSVAVDFLSDYRRVLPLFRALKNKRFDVFHLHWPEAYFPRMRDGLDLFRRARFPLDLALAARGRPLVVTAHNLFAHDRRHEWFAQANARAALRRADAVIAHSEGAKMELVQSVGISPERCHVILHGDLSVPLGEPVSRELARQKLALSPGKYCLIFGAMKPYKGMEEIIEFWRETKPDAQLVLAGEVTSETYGAELRQRMAGLENVVADFRRLSDEDLRFWLSAADAVILNYRAIFTSGAAGLARSWGVPILLPSRLRTVDLQEPHPLVFRFEKNNLSQQLHAALNTPPSYAAAESWRRLTNWDNVAKKTAAVYRNVLPAVAQTPLDK